MRSPAVILLFAVSLVAGLLPCYRCTPTEAATCGTTVLLGSHAHECQGHAAGERGEEGGNSHDSDGSPCCVHEASDPSAPPTRQASLALGAAALVPAIAGDDTRSYVVPVLPVWRAPHRRGSTETVVLLR